MGFFDTIRQLRQQQDGNDPSMSILDRFRPAPAPMQPQPPDWAEGMPSKTAPSFLTAYRQNAGQTLGGLEGPGAATQQYGFGSAIAPWTKEFAAPSAEEALNTPGLQYALDRAKQAIERSAAAKGTLLTGGLLRDLSENQIGMALQGYGDTYNRSRDQYLIGRENFWENQQKPFDKYVTLAGLGKPV